MRRPRFVLRRTDAGWYFVLKASNSETILVSEMYESKAAANKGINSVKRNAVLAAVTVEPEGP